MAVQPKYHEIAEDLRRRIRSGEFAQGTKLPPEDDLGDHYEASRNTIRQAVDRLTREGLVAKRQGQGTFVTMKVDPFVTVLSTRTPGIDGGGVEGIPYLSQVAAEHRQPKSSNPEVGVTACPAEIAVGLGIDPGQDVISRHQKWYIGDVLWSQQTSFYPYDLHTRADRLLKAGNIEEGTVKYLAKTWGLDQVGYRDWVRVRPADSNEQQSFRVGPDELMFEVYRIAFAHPDAAQTQFTRRGIPEGYLPTRVMLTVYPADRNLLVTNYGEVPELYEAEMQPPQPERQQPG